MTIQKNTETLNEFEAAKLLGISVSWLRQSRLRNPKWAGPSFVKRDGWRVEYRRRDLIAFKNKRKAKTVQVNPADRFAAA